MNTQPTINVPQRSGALDRLTTAWQWIVVSLFALGTLVLLGENYKLHAPGAPVPLFWVSVAVGVLVAIAHSPNVIGRLPGRWKGIPYLAGIGFLTLFAFVGQAVNEAWERTPQGAAEAKEYAARRDAEIAAGVEQRAQEASLKEADELREKVADAASNLESCFTTFGHRLPALENSVKENLHNPAAFEHVETVAIVPDVDRNNVAMKFRAENGFGALRLGVVKASVDPDTCEIVSQGDAEPL